MRQLTVLLCVCVLIFSFWLVLIWFGLGFFSLFPPLDGFRTVFSLQIIVNLCSVLGFWFVGFMHLLISTVLFHEDIY